MDSRLDFLSSRDLSSSRLLNPHNRSRNTRISGTKLDHEGESEPIVGAAEERQEYMLITRVSGGRQSTVDDNADVRLGSGEDFPDVMRVDDLRGVAGRDSPFEQVFEWVESDGTNCTIARGDPPGNQQHL